MLNSRLMSLIRKEFIQIVRDPRTLALTFVLPVLMLFLLGYAATNDVKNVPLAIFDQDRSAESRRLLDAYRAADYFQLAVEVGSEEEIRSLIDRNTVRAGLIIPPDYGQKIASGRSAQIAFLLDGSDPNVANTALAAATMVGQSFATDLMVERLDRAGQAGTVKMPLEVRTRVLYNPAMVSAYYMIPGLIGMILQLLTTMLTATSIVRERERGTIEQLIVTPLRSWELVVGKLIPYVLIAFFDMLEILVIGVLVFKVPINGSLGLFLALSALFLVGSLGMGLFISTIAHTQQEAMLSTMFTLYPSIFLSGFFFPLAAMPQVLQWISYAVPMRYFLIIARGVILKGVGLEDIWIEVVALSIFSLVMMGAAAARFRKRLD